MARVLFVTWNGGGNLPPTIGVAQAMRQRGHRIGFLGQESQRRHLEAAGFALAAYRREAGSLSCLCGTERQAQLMKTVWMNDDFAEDVYDKLDSEPFDFVVVDCMLIGALARSKLYPVPTVVLVHSLFASVLKVRDGMLMMGNKLRVDAGLPPFDLSEATWESKDLVLATTLNQFDKADPLSIPNVRYVGPVFEKRPKPEGWGLPWCENDARPLVLVSFSTNADQSSVALLQEALDSLGNLDARVLMTTGGAVLPESLRPPTNAKVMGFVPHELVLPHADVMITHGGHGSVMAALSHGVPLVCKPSLGADQAIIAKRVEELGLGKAIGVTSELREAAKAVLGDPAFKVAARQFKDMIAREDGAVVAAKEIEAFLSRKESPSPSVLVV